MTKDDIKLLLSEDLSPYKLTLLIVIHLYLCNELPIPQLITLTQLIETNNNHDHIIYYQLMILYIHYHNYVNYLMI